MENQLKEYNYKSWGKKKHFSMILNISPGKIVSNVFIFNGDRHNQTLFDVQTCSCCAEWPNGIKHVWSQSKRKKCFTMFIQLLLSNVNKHDKTR